MKLILCLSVLTISQLFAIESYSQLTKLSLKLEDVKISDALKEIENESEFFFLYSPKLIDVDRKVNIDAENEPIRDILTNIFDDKVKFAVFDRQVILTPAEQSGVLSAIQQQKKMSGVVSDKNGSPLPGVNVVVTGTNQGAITDFEGKYNIEVPQGAKSLTLTFIGMETQEIVIGNLSQINVTMIESEIGLNEVVVIGYGTTTKRKLVSAVSNVETESIKEVPYSNLNEALVGRAAGVIVATSGGEPGKLPQISIRGSSAEPLYVIDGIISSTFDFSTIPVTDIENVSFLKDASATAIYGSRAADGIVLVTTKRGKQGKVKMNYEINYQLSSPTVLPDKTDSYTVATSKNVAAANDGFAPIYSQEVLDKIKNQTDPYLYPNNNWYDLCLRKAAPQLRQNLSLSGGDQRTSYYLSLGYFDQEGIYKLNSVDLKRYNYRANIDTKFDKIGLTVSLNLNGSIENKRFPSRNEFYIWSHIINSSPLDFCFDAQGRYAAKVDHALVETDPASGYDKTNQSYANNALVFSWSSPSVKGLTLQALGNYEKSDYSEKLWWVLAPQYDIVTGEVQNTGLPALTQTAKDGYEYNIEGHVYYVRTFNNHTIDLSFVYNQNYNYQEWFNAYRRDYVSSAVDQMFAGPNAGKDDNGSASEAGRVGYVSRIKYDYKGKYVVEGNFRYDGSDLFPSGKRWGFFPSISGGWVISEEGFMGDLKSKNILNMLKVRASYGTVGNDNVGRFAYVPAYNLAPSVLTVNGNLLNGYSEGQLVSQDLTWYTTKSLNYGLDFSTLSDKLSGSFDYFYMRTTGFLISPTNIYYTPLGKPLPTVKSNSAQRRAGFEFNIQYKGDLNEFKYVIGANFTKFDQLWEEKDDETEADLKNPYRRVTHQTDYYGFGYESLGLYQSAEDVMNSPRTTGGTALAAGDLKYNDFNGDGMVDESDEIRMGKQTFPHIFYGINFSLKYKGFALLGLMQGTGDRDMFLGNNLNNSGASTMLYTYQLDYWTPDNTGAYFTKPTTLSGVNGNNNGLVSTHYLINARYIRLKSISLTYDLKNSLLKNQNYVSSCLLSVNATNLFTISPAMKYFDPEIGSENAYTYPTQKVISFGLNVGF